MLIRKCLWIIAKRFNYNVKKKHFVMKNTNTKKVCCQKHRWKKKMLQKTQMKKQLYNKNTIQKKYVEKTQMKKIMYQKKQIK